MSAVAWGVIVGLALGLGIWSMVSALPSLNRLGLEERLAPYLLDVSAEARVVAERRAAAARPLAGTAGALFGPALVATRDRLLRVIGGEESVALRLRQAGSSRSVESFRLRQLLAAAAGAAVGCAAMAVLGQARPVSAPAWAASAATGALAGFLIRDAWLSRAVRRRLARIAEEFPTVAELLALSLSAGEGIHDALRRIARASSGELGAELRIVSDDVGLGLPLAQALVRFDRALRLPALTRFTDAVVGALDRGSPLAEVLRAHAADARTERKRELLEAAGRKEIQMLVPLIFGLLPLTVLIAVFPGVFILQAGL